MFSNWKTIAGIVGAAMVAGALIVWLVYFNGPKATIATDDGTSFGAGGTRSTTSVAPSETNGTLPSSNAGIQTSQKVFKISAGPVAGATLVQAGVPTTTVARFMLATNGHTLEVSLDTSGAVPKTVSNTTIPGVVDAEWTEAGKGIVFRYLDQSTIKTAHLSLPAPLSTTSAPIRIQFLPQGIASFAVSPDGASATYLLKTASGADAYVSSPDGGGAKQLFSLPLSQVQLSWPSSGTILAQTAPASGVPGVVFAADAKSGAVSPLIYSNGLTATADKAFSRVLYQTAGSDGRRSYAQNVKTGLSIPLSFDPTPELCRWSPIASSTVYCATPLTYVEPNYLDQLHMGLTNTQMSIVSYDLSAARSDIITTPGGADGGVPSQVADLSVSPDGRYLIFIRKGDRSLWAVRLTN